MKTIKSSEKDEIKLRTTNKCIECSLIEIDLSGENLYKIDLYGNKFSNYLGIFIF